MTFLVKGNSPGPEFESISSEGQVSGLARGRRSYGRHSRRSLDYPKLRRHRLLSVKPESSAYPAAIPCGLLADDLLNVSCGIWKLLYITLCHLISNLSKFFEHPKAIPFHTD